MAKNDIQLVDDYAGEEVPDSLDRLPFVEKLTNLIKDAPCSNESYVIGLEAQWGDGKTWIINQIAKKFDEEQVFRFSPWEWSNEKNIFSGFWREFSIALQGLNICSVPTLVNEYEDAIDRNSYGKAIRLLSQKSLQENIFITSLTVIITMLLSYNLANGIVSFIDNFLSFVGLNAPLPFIIFLLWFTISCLVLSLITSGFNRFNTTIESTKKSIARKLGKFHKRLLIIIDDIDRLPPPQVSEIFQIIKANANYPNIVYLLAYDPIYIREALKKQGYNSDNVSFHEKIINFPVPIPSVSSDAMWKKITTLLQDIGKNYFANSSNQSWEDIEKRLTRDRVGSGQPVIFLRDYILLKIKNLRDLKRLQNSFSNALISLSSDNVLEVNFIDLLIIEVLHIKENDTYLYVRGSRVFKNLRFNPLPQNNTLEDAIIDYYLNKSKKNLHLKEKSLADPTFFDLYFDYSFVNRLTENDFLKIKKYIDLPNEDYQAKVNSEFPLHKQMLFAQDFARQYYELSKETSQKFSSNAFLNLFDFYINYENYNFLHHFFDTLEKADKELVSRKILNTSPVKLDLNSVVTR